MTAVLITGASGFIGQQVLGQLHREPGDITKIVALDVRETPPAEQFDGVVYATGDIRDRRLVDTFIEHDVDTVVHLAAVVTPGKDSTRELEHSIDVEGSRTVLEACLQAGVTQLVYTSSGAAYGYHGDNPTPLRESDALRGNPEFAYSDHKRLVEEMLAAARREHPELTQLIFRPGTILGDHANNQITAIFDRPVVIGVRESESPFVIVWDRDVAAAIVKGVRERRGGIYNLAGDGTITLREIARRLNKPYLPLPTVVLAAALRGANMSGLAKLGPEQVIFLRHRPVLANEALKQDFGFTPSLSSAECFDAFVAARTHANTTDGRPSDAGRRRVVITGGAGGIGAALARRYAAQGARVAILDRDESDPPGDGGLALRCDVTDERSCAEAIESIAAAFDGIDVLVNNAGLTHIGTFGDTAPDVLRRVMEVNYFGAVHCTNAALPYLLASRGQVVVVSSVAGFAPLHGRSGYCASKHALHGFFDTLRAEYGGAGLRVLLACPSFVDTDIGAHALGVDGALAGASARTGVRAQLSPDVVASRVIEAAAKNRRLVFIPAEARLAWWISRLAPRAYEALMLRRTTHDGHEPGPDSPKGPRQ